MVDKVKQNQLYMVRINQLRKLAKTRNLETSVKSSKTWTKEFSNMGG